MMMPCFLVSLKIMETNRVTLEWGCNPFWSDLIDFAQSCIAGIVAAFTLTLDVNEPYHCFNGDVNANAMVMV